MLTVNASKVLKVSDQKPWKTTFHGNGAAFKKTGKCLCRPKINAGFRQNGIKHTKLIPV